MEKNTVIINKKTASTTKTLEVIGDVIVPDIKPDIVNIINTNGIPYIYKEDITTGRVRLDGNIDTYVVYLADNGETRSIQTTLSFSDSIEEATITEKSFSKENISLEMIEAKVLNERKISIRASVKVRSEIFEQSQIEITSDFNEIENVEKLKETLDIKSIVGSNRIKTSIKEDISVDSSFSVAELLKTDVEITNLENKISYNKVLAKADANVKVVFLSEDGRIGVADSTIPVMSFIDIDKITDTHTCNVEYSIRNMLFKVNSKEMHSVIACQIDFEVSCEAFETKTIDVIQDMYGIKNNIEFTKREVEVQVSQKESIEKININERVGIEDILNICDVNCKPRLVNRTRSGNYFNCECEMNMSIYYEANNRNGLNVKDITLPFMIKTESEEEFAFSISRKQFTVSNENVNCDIEVLARKESDSLKRITVIDNVSSSENEEDDEYKMFMYFVKSGDTIWNIAKRFRVCMKDIIALNNLENPDRINVGDRLYIMR